MSRKQLVKTVESSVEIDKGGPQGSILGPLLFVVCINNIFNNFLTECTILSFADDTVIFYSSKSWATTLSALNLV